MQIKLPPLLAVSLLCAISIMSCAKKAEVCNLSVSEMPTVSGFSLIQRFEDIQNRFPELQLVGSDRVFTLRLKNPKSAISGREDANLVFLVNTGTHPEFQSIENVELFFFERRIFNIVVTYGNKPRWTNHQAFIAESVNTLNFPYALKEHDKFPTMAATSCSAPDPNLPLDFSAIQLGFADFEGKPFPTVRLLDGADYVLMARAVNQRLSNSAIQDSTSSTIPVAPDDETRRRYEECVRQRTAFGVDTSPCSEWAKER